MADKSPLDYPCPTCHVDAHALCLFERFGTTPKEYVTIEGRSHRARVVIAERKSKPRGKRRGK